MKTAVLLVVAVILSFGTAWATCGAAYFNNDITWWHNSPLYYSVAGAPANTCGDLYAQRNADAGFDLEAGDWICTDGSGNATKGPWLWQNQGDDETASAYIDWGSCTSPVASHIWDKGWPTASVTSSCPSAFSGTASDDTWGAGFDSDWAICEGEFKNTTTGKWYDPGSGAYDSNYFTTVTCTCSGMPSMSITWSCPLPSTHVSGHHYLWSGWVFDGGQWNNPQTDPTRCNFTY